MEPKKLVILGCGGTGIDILDLIDDVNKSKKKYSCIGFLDDDSKQWGKEVSGVPVLGALKKASEFEKVSFVNGLGSPSNYWKTEEIISDIGIKAEQFETIVHPMSVVSKKSVLGFGVIVYSHVFIGANAKIGNLTTLLANTTINHNSVFEEFNIVCSNVSVSGAVKVGKSCYLGAGSSIRQNVTIGDRCLLGMGSVVLNDVAPNNTVAGNPAVFLRKNDL
jgi:sugar O-acyltransferase (sialic acid O-acetyltransferase NeuD family)